MGCNRRAGRCGALVTPAVAVIDLAGLDLTASPTFRPECVLWVALLGSLAFVGRDVWTDLARAGQLRWVGAVTAIGAALRAGISFVPQNWYFAIANIPPPAGIVLKTTVFQPLPTVLLLSYSTSPLGALRLFNIVVGTAVVPLLTYVVLRAGYRSRVARLCAVIAALLPLYVRYSAMDGPQIVILFLFAAAAAAYVRLATCPAPWPKAEQVLLACAVIAAAPIRPESTLPLLSIPFFLFHGPATRSLRGLWHARPTIVLALAWIVGCAWSLAFHLHDLAVHPGPDAFKLVLRGLVTATMMINPALVAWVPLILLVPIWITAVRLLRRRAWDDLRSLYAPVVFCALPLIAVGPQNHLVGLGYVVLQSVFVVLASARCVDALLLSVDAGELRVSVRTRAAAVAAIGAVALVSVVPPLTYRYAFQDEYLFLRQALPAEPATILTISDMWPDGPGDFDCCLLQPYPPLLAEYPHLRWIIVGKDALTSQAFRDLHFDYYYPGSMAAVDAGSVDQFFLRRLGRWLGTAEDEEARRKKAHLAAIQRLDAAIRGSYAMDAVSTASTPTHVFSDADFPDGRMELTLYRRRAARP